MLTIYVLGFMLWAAGTTFIPWLIPLLYAAIPGLVLQGVEPFFLSCVLTSGAVLGTVSLWYVDRYFDARIQKWLDTHATFTANSTTRLGRALQRLHDKAHIAREPRILFWLTSIMTFSVIPDIIIVRAVRKKMSLPVFISATLLGKLFVYTPVVYGVDLLDMLIATFT